MKLKQIAAAAVAAGLLTVGSAAQAQVALAESFDNVAGLAAAGWTFLNNSTSPGTNWFQGNSGIFPAASGAADAYAAANFLSTTGTTGAVSNWLITPQLLLDATSEVSLLVQVGGEGFVDTLQVLVSTTGTAPADFSLIGSYSASANAGWVPLNFSAQLAGSSQAYVAFRYVVDDVAVNGNYVGIDNLVVSAVPEPMSAVLFGLGLAGLAAVRTRRQLSV